jgi:hypothetical protein
MFRHDALAKGRFKRVPSHWDTEFGRWVSDFGVPRIVSALARDPDLRVTNNAIYQWLGGRSPRPARALALVHFAMMHGFTGFGIQQKGPHAKRFIHLDDDSAPDRPMIWSS